MVPCRQHAEGSCWQLDIASQGYWPGHSATSNRKKQAQTTCASMKYIIYSRSVFYTGRPRRRRRILAPGNLETPKTPLCYSYRLDFSMSGIAVASWSSRLFHCFLLGSYGHLRPISANTFDLLWLDHCYIPVWIFHFQIRSNFAWAFPYFWNFQGPHRTHCPKDTHNPYF